MKTLVLPILALFLALPASALTPEQGTYLSSIGLNPASEDVRIAEKDGEISTTFMDEPTTFSLVSMISEKKKNGLIRFVTTRAFISKLKQSFDSVSIPATNFETLYLTQDERTMAGRKFALSLLKKK